MDHLRNSINASSEAQELRSQLNKMYSEEDMKLSFEAGYEKGFSGYPNTENWKELSFSEWFKQSKK